MQSSNAVAISVLVRLCLLFAALKVVVGIIALVAGVQPLQRPVPDFVLLINILIFGAVGSLLIYASRNDHRATYLGVAFVLIASSFSDPLVRRLPDTMPFVIGYIVDPLSSIHPDAFLPYFLWLFFYY